ncbi:right-handed parallel beta-helix repeat-containing protein [Gaoshiqia sp. Z1-71]|uniref:right-handed parallel beta-helix repeat-containing protein n=1 Tax=Gaoshiqia hydrogeniformans TaxID=3290090 RepID=UPI003BF7D1D8
MKQLILTCGKFSLTIFRIMIGFTVCSSCSQKPALPVAVLTGVYYLDAEDGDDKHSGLSVSTAWKTIEHVNKQTFGSGAQVLFKAGQNWYGSLQPSGSGEAGKPVTFGRYGDGPRPAIHGQGEANTVHLKNIAYTTLRDLEITNYAASEEKGISLEEWERRNVTDWFQAINPSQHVSGNSLKTGVRITATDMGEVNQVQLINLHVHGVNGAINQNDEKTKNNGGIFIEITGNRVPTWFNGLLIENCHIHDVDRTGLSNVSSWDRRTLTTNENWTPSLNVVIRNNVFERAGANALIVRVAKNPLMEHNLFHQNGIKGSGNAAFNFNTDGALWQYNESRFTKKNRNDADAGGLDCDYRTKNTIIQYNYLHDNDFGMLVTGGPGNYGGFNDRTIVRYNIFEREGLAERDGESKYAFKVGGKATNTFVHNNVFYLSPSQEDVQMIYHKDWGGDPERTYYYNNIFYMSGNNHGYSLGNSGENHFFNNLCHGNTTINWPVSENPVYDDPLFLQVGNGPAGYQIKAGSPAINIGVVLPEAGAPVTDYFGNPLPVDGPVELGVHQMKR